MLRSAMKSQCSKFSTVKLSACVYLKMRFSCSIVRVMIYTTFGGAPWIPSPTDFAPIDFDDSIGSNNCKRNAAS